MSGKKWVFKRLTVVIVLIALTVGVACTFSACRQYDKILGEQPLTSVSPTKIPSATATPTLTVSSGISSDVAVGDIVQFGAYEQDNNTSNG